MMTEEKDIAQFDLFVDIENEVLDNSREVKVVLNKDYFTRTIYAVIYCGGDLFTNKAGKERETRYVVVKDCGENEAIKIMDAKNKFLSKESKGHYAYTAMWRLNYILSGHKDENGIERNGNKL